MNDSEKMRIEFDKFKQRRELQARAENTKMAVVGILMLSVFIFAILGKGVARHFGDYPLIPSSQISLI